MLERKRMEKIAEDNLEINCEKCNKLVKFNLYK